MADRAASKSREIRSRLGHPVIDSDGHTVEFLPGFFDVLRTVAGRRVADRYLNESTANSPCRRAAADPALCALARQSLPRQRVRLRSGVGEVRRVESSGHVPFGRHENGAAAHRSRTGNTITSVISRRQARRCAKRCSSAASRAGSQPSSARLSGPHA
jgi:hypothetical protein